MYGKYAVLLLFLAAPALAQGTVAVRAAADRQAVTIGDPVAYTVTLAHPAGIAVAAPPKTAELGPWEVKDVQVREAQKPETATIVTYTLTTFTTGEALIPELTFKYTDDKGAAGEVATSPLKIMVESVLAQEKDVRDIRDIKPPLSLPLPLFLYLLIVLFLAAALYGLWYWHRSRAGGAAAAPENAVPPVPPYQRALEALMRLRESGLVREGRIKEFYIALTDILRDYLAGVYGIETRDRTTGEICAQLKKCESDKKFFSAVRDFFDECDLVKFARYRPDETTCDEDWEKAKQIVAYGMKEQETTTQVHAQVSNRSYT